MRQTVHRFFISGLHWRTAVPAAALVLLLYVVIAPILSIAREFVIGAFAVCLRLFVSNGIWRSAIDALHLDPIYAKPAIRSLGTIESQGLAIAGPFGALLHHLESRVFAAPDHVVNGAFTSLVVAPGASVLARTCVTLAADLLVLPFRMD